MKYKYDINMILCNKSLKFQYIMPLFDLSLRFSKNKAIQKDVFLLSY